MRTWISLLLPPAILVGGVLAWHWWQHQHDRRVLPGEGHSEVRCERQFNTLGTTGRLELWGEKSLTEAVANEMVERLQSLHNRLNLFDNTSELSRLNRNAAQKPFPCSQELWDILLAARAAHRETRGAFDLSGGPLLKLWNGPPRRTAEPGPEEIRAALASVGMDKIRFDDQARTLFFTRPGMSLDLSVMANGYALDQAAAMAETAGIHRGMIHLGDSSICLSLPPPSALTYSVGLRDPAGTPDHPQEILHLLAATAAATSANAAPERSLDQPSAGRIMDPKTGRPVTQIIAATVVTRLGVNAEMWAAAIVVAGPTLAQELIHAYPETYVLLTCRQADGRLSTTKYPNPQFGQNLPARGAMPTPAGGENLTPPGGQFAVADTRPGDVR